MIQLHTRKILLAYERGQIKEDGMNDIRAKLASDSLNQKPDSSNQMVHRLPPQPRVCVFDHLALGAHLLLFFLANQRFVSDFLNH